jgi:hypothetical protein
MRHPVAAAIAFAMAAAPGAAADSPIPFAPNGPCRDGTSTMMVLTFGMDSIRGIA